MSESRTRVAQMFCTSVFWFSIFALSYVGFAVELTVMMYMKYEPSFDDKTVTAGSISTRSEVHTFIQCALLCSFEDECLSFFYGGSDATCITHKDVFYDPSLGTAKNGYVYYRIVKGNSEKEPIKDCGDPSSFIPANHGLEEGLTHSRVLRYFTCPPPYVQKKRLRCLDNGTWEFNLNCGPLRTCEDIQKCSAENLDGEYNLYPEVFNSKPVKVYCDGLTNKTTPWAYLTLHETNIASMNFSEVRFFELPECNLDLVDDPFAYVYFQKVGINETDVSIRDTDLKYTQGVIKLSASQLKKFKYGVAWDCATHVKNCTRLGYFEINLNGTGLALNPSTAWEEIGMFVMSDIIRSNDNLKAQGRCGGHCGRCQFSGRAYLTYIDNAEVRGPAANIPYC